jgi:poly-beta-1,6-N-acetyl-D-glucosamine biosynthesis protein PgaD
MMDFSQSPNPVLNPVLNQALSPVLTPLINQSTKPLIFDTSRVPWCKRYLLRLIDATGWGLWLLLWMPLTLSAEKLLSSGGHMDSALAGLLGAVGFGALAVLVMAAAFLGWTLLQRLGALALRRRLSRARQFLKSEVLAKAFSINHQSLSQWQDSQIMLAHHSDDTGWLQHIDALPFIDRRDFDASPPAIIWKPL